MPSICFPLRVQTPATVQATLTLETGMGPPFSLCAYPQAPVDSRPPCGEGFCWGATLLTRTPSTLELSLPRIGPTRRIILSELCTFFEKYTQ